jgi:site-specific DNA-methyltransferase (adenine-specific)
MTLPAPYYQDAAVTLYCGDCREILPHLEPVDHVITDPPYEAEAHTLARRGNTARDGFAVRDYVIDFDPIDEGTRSTVGTKFAELSRGWILIFAQVEAVTAWKSALAPARYLRTQIWRKPNGACQFTGDRPGMGYEVIVTAWAGKSRSSWNGGGRHGFYVHNNVPHDTGHMTQKPLSLMLELVTLFSNPNETILDPFAGSGTTLLAAKNLGRKAIGIEMSPKYCDVIVKRLRQEVLPLT